MKEARCKQHRVCMIPYVYEGQNKKIHRSRSSSVLGNGGGEVTMAGVGGMTKITEVF
jgi:hypothetical protein